MAQEEKNTPTNLEIGIEATSELQVSQKGDHNYVNLLRLYASLSMSDFLSLEVSSLSTCMTAEESIGDDLQTFSNLDAGDIPFAVSMLNLGWCIDERQSLYLGIRNMNEDYFTSDVTSFFTNSSCGIYPTISANYSIANYPLASMGMHYSYTAEQWGVQASLYNGRGYEHFTGKDNVFRFRPSNDGIFSLVQVEHNSNGSHYYLGNALYCNQDVSLTPWFYAEQRLNDNFTLIVGYSHAFGEDVECSDFLGAGVHVKLRSSELGLFSDYSRFAEGNEVATELTCMFHFGQHVYIQPIAHVILTEQQWNSIYSVRIGLQF